MLKEVLRENPRALIVDDNDEFRNVISRQLAFLGFEVLGTADASEFLSELMSSAQPFDLAVIDIQLPGLQGDQIISWVLSSDDPKIKAMPILIVTGLLQERIEIELELLSKIEFLEKPYELQQLETAIKTLLKI